MQKMRRLICALALVGSLTAVPAAAQTQVPPASGGFDAYYAAAVATGVIVGAAVAIVVTDGLILPAYAYMTGTAVEAGAMAGAGMAAAEAGAATGAGAAGAGAATQGTLHWMGSSLMHFGSTGFSSAMGVLGGLVGGLYADSRYRG